ncbi:MAG: DUF4258 domain-containing protein [Dehalococcoidales bacterium]|nr:DUF4258 domain-containing protein [Dehalococcoidales bacterium]
MGKILEQIIKLIEQGQVIISEHGYNEIVADKLYVRDIILAVNASMIIEEYPEYSRGPCVLVLQRDREGQPVHVVWGIPKGKKSPAVLVTAYRPDPERWEENFLRRRK